MRNSNALLIVGLLFCLCSQYAIAQGSVKKTKEFFEFDEQVINGTTGTPLGGFGCGAVKFDANTGTFAVMTTPPADAYDFKSHKGACLHFTSKRGDKEVKVETLKASLTDGRPNDDAIWPLHRVNFGTVNGVEVKMTGISPLDNQNYENMHLPYALYEIVLTNTQKEKTETTFTFQWNSDKPLVALNGKGIANEEWCLMAEAAKGKVITKDSRVTVKANLGGGESATLRYVLAWYNRTDSELGYYMNLYQQPEEIAKHGLKVFDTLKHNAENLVEGMRASNLPGWIKNHTLNTLVNVVTNSMYKKDGRVAFAEGQWTCFGTMDQMWIARQIVYQLLPFYAWEELNYWARTQMKNGQIHHDFNVMEVGDAREKRSTLVAWDDTEHADYRNIQKWVDLNCALIISVFEAYRATVDKERFDFLWPYVKKAAQRILDQVEAYGSKKYPYTFDDSENSYDAGGNPDPYNANISAVAYKIMMILAEEKGETELVKIYGNAYEQVKKSFRNRYIKNNERSTGKHCESIFAGQALAYHLKLGEIWSAEDTDLILDKLENYYYPYYWGLGYPQGTYDEWTPYIVAHYGGLLLNTGRLEHWYVMQKDSYVRQYWDRDRVFDHPLNILPVVEKPKWISDNIKSKKQYISIPALWRNYYDIIGFQRDARTKELWIKPILHKSMNGCLENAMYISPEGCGYISYKESGKEVLKKDITIKPERTLQVGTLYLTDNFKGDVSVQINGKSYSYKRVGSGYAKEIAVDWNDKITDKGIHIKIQGITEVNTVPAPLKPASDSVFIANVNQLSPFKRMDIEKADKQAGTKISQKEDGNKYMTSCNNFDYVQFSNMDFGHKVAKKFKGRFSGLVEGAEVEIVLDDNSNTAIGKCKIPYTGKDNWVELECPLKEVTEMHHVILRFYGGSSENLMEVDWIQFE